MISDKTIKVKDPCGFFGNWDHYTSYSNPGSFFFYNSRSKNYAFGSNPNDRQYYFHHCREVVSAWWRNYDLHVFHKKDLGFYGVRSIELLDEFFNIIETKLVLENKTVFHPINDGEGNDGEGVIAFPSDFWLKDSYRYGFFTLFLRCGARYYTGDFRGAISNYELTARIKRAIRLFLEGKTCFNGEFNSKGVVSSLRDLNVKELKNIMVSEKEKIAWVET